MSDQIPDWHRRMRELERRCDNRTTDIARLWQAAPQVPEWPGYAMPVIVPSTTAPPTLGSVVGSGFSAGYCSRFNGTFGIVTQTTDIPGGNSFALAYRTYLNGLGVQWLLSLWGRYTDEGESDAAIHIFCSATGPGVTSGSVTKQETITPWPGGFSADYSGLIDWLTDRTITLSVHVNPGTCTGTVEVTLEAP